MKLQIQLQLLVLFFIAACSGHAVRSAKLEVVNKNLFYSDGVLNIEYLNDQLGQCEIVKELNHDLAKRHSHQKESYIEHFFQFLFPFGPALNSLVAMFYISGPPTLILALLPESIDPSKLSLLVSFAVGGLLGDTFLHLLPQIFVGEPSDEFAHFVYVDEKRNTILALFIFVGFIFFFLIDKGLRVLHHGEEEKEGGHSHSHSHTKPESSTSALPSKDASGLKQRKKEVTLVETKEAEDEKHISASVRTAAWLNLISDFTHNITDGLAICSSFYISRNVGSTTALAIFLHEVPHQVGDFAVLIQGGFTKWQATNSQFVTATGAFLGCFIGIAIQAVASKAVGETAEDLIASSLSNGLFNTTVTISDLTLPFTAGGFLYIATVGVIPEVLELSKGTTKVQELKNSTLQLICIFIGIGLMFAISWFE